MKLNILFITSWYPTKYLPYNGDFVQRHAQAVALFARTTVIHIASAEQRQKFLIQETYSANVREILVFHQKVQSSLFLIKSLKNLFLKYKAFKLAMKMIQKQGKIDLAHVHVLFPAGIFALFLKIKYKLPYIVTEHWSKFLPESDINFSRTELFLMKYIARKAAFVCPVSGNLKKAMLSLGLFANYQIVPNVVNTQLFFPLPDKKKQKLLKFIHISGMTDRVKNITGIINAAKKAYDIHPHFVLTFVGSDSSENYKLYANQIGLPKNVLNFIGLVPYEKVAEMMQEYDVLLMFSNYENAPCVISEALVSGLPVISSAVGGIPEMIDDTNGYLVPKQNEDELALKMLKMIKHYQVFNRKRIAEAAKLKYAYELVGKQYLELYNQALKL